MASRRFRLAGNWWLLLGGLAFLATSVSSIVRSLEPMPLGDALYLILDWFAACVIYFFFAAAIGHVVDWLLARRRGERVRHPLWLWLTLGLWLFSSLLATVFASGQVGFWLVLFFPFAYGIFFTGFAFTMLAPGLVTKTFYGKAVLDVLYLAVFGGWLYLAVTGRSRLARRALLVVLFAVLAIGVVGCARALAA